MIISNLISIGDDGIGTEVQIHLVAPEENLQHHQCELELVGIYEALSKKFSMDIAVEIITNATKLFLDHHS